MNIFICERCGIILEGTFKADKKYCITCSKIRQKAQIKEWASKNKERVLEIKTKHRKTDKFRDTSDKYYLSNREAILQRTGEYQKEHREQANASYRRWYAKNDVYYKNKRARLRVSGSFTKNEIMYLRYEQGNMCNCCGLSLDYGYHVDHIYPITPREGFKGGSNNIGNLQLLCPYCNVSKGNKDPSQIDFNQWVFNPVNYI